MIYLAILAGTIVIGGLAMTSLVAKNMAPGKKRFALETTRMKQDMDQWAGELIPINKEELELFSLGQDKQVLRKGITTTAKGIYTTIYNEPVLAYSYREYLGKADKPNGLLVARTAEHDYYYWINKGVANLYIDGQEVGTISRDGVLTGKKTGKVIATLDKKGERMLPVTVGSREVGSLTKKQANAEKGLQERAFEFLANELNDKEEQLFLALILEELVSRSIRS
jgi:hypothetical protein